MRLIFCGTPQFAVPSLQELIARPDFEILAVVTQPDRPKGRGNEISFSPVKQAALGAGIAIHQPQKIRAPEFQSTLQSLAPDVIVIIAYGQIIPARLLTIPKLGWINLHASLLPKYRGAAPINWAIVNGETTTGLTTMRIDAGMDTGDMLLQEELSIGPKETASQLAARMSETGAALMLKTLRGLSSGTIAPRSQNHQAATYAPLLKKEDGRIDWRCGARAIHDLVRAVAPPFPGAFTEVNGCRLAVLETRVDTDPLKYPAQSPCLYSSDGTWYADCIDGRRLKILQLTANGEPVAENTLPRALAHQPLALA